MNKLTLPKDPVTVEQAALLLADAANPGADEAARVSNFRWMLNGLLADVHNGKLRARLPTTRQQVGPEGIAVHDYASIMVFIPDDIRALAAERGIECEDSSERPARRAEHGAQRQPSRRDLLAPLIEQAIAQEGEDAPRVFTTLRTWAAEHPPRPPLRGVTEDGRVQWSDANDAPKELTVAALRERLRRRQERS